MTVAWTRGALADVSEIRDFIAKDSPEAADRVLLRLVTAIERLEKFPQSAKEIFRSSRGTVRALVDPPYQILYVVTQKTILISAVVHGRRDLAQLLSSVTERP